MDAGGLQALYIDELRRSLRPPLDPMVNPRQTETLIRRAQCDGAAACTAPNAVTWIWSDQHLGHEHSRSAFGRPFRTAAEADRAMMEAWYDQVAEGETVICLGDITVDGEALAHHQDWWRRAPGTKWLALGNHDVDPVNRIRPFESDRTAVTLYAAGDSPLLLTHVPLVQVPHADRRGRRHRRQDAVREYLNVYLPRDEGIPRLRLTPHGQMIHIPDLYTEAELKTSPAYNEGLRRTGSRKGWYVRFDGPDGLRIVWGVGDPVGTRDWQSDQFALLERLLPHIRQCVVVRQALAGADAVGGGLTDLLDNRHIGVLQLDRRGRVVAANAHAVTFLRRGDGLFDEGGSLHARLAADEDRLQRLLARALPASGSESPAGGSMRVRSRSGGGRLSLHVSPVGGAQADFGGRRVAALVLVVDAASRPRIDPEWVAAALGLTPAEGRAAALLAEGRTVREIVAETGYRESYVRTLLKRTYRKQGVPGQAALVQRVLAIDALPRG